MTIPAIPAGAQLGGAGTAENQAQAQMQGGAPAQAPTVPVAPAIPAAQVQEPNPALAAQLAAQQAHQPAAQPTDVPPTPVRDPVTGQWVLPAQVPSTPLIPTAAPTAAAPVPEVPTDTPKSAPAIGETYLETSVNHFSAEIGVQPEAIMESIAAALKHKDSSLINVSNLGNLTPEQVVRAQQLAQMAYQHTQAEIQTLHDTVVGVAGGVDQWNTAVNAFNTSATPEAKRYVEYLVEYAQDGKQAAEYVIKYVTESGLITQVNKAPVQGGVGAPVATGLSVQEYKNGIHEIEILRNQRQITQSEYDVRMADLDYRRGIGRQQGR